MLDDAMRCRSKSKSFGVHESYGHRVRWHLPDGSTTDTETNSSVYFPRGFDYIEYEVGREFFKNCRHESYQYNIDSTISPIHVALPNQDWTSATSVELWSPSAAFQSQIGVYTNLADFAMATNAQLADAMVYLLPSFNSMGGNFNLPNFIYELGDLSKLAKLPKSIWDFIRKFYDQAKRQGLPLRYPLRTLERLLKDGTLSWNFAIRPLISDVQKMHTRLYKLAEIIEAWNEDARKGQIRTNHYMIENSDEYESHYDVWNPNGVIGRTQASGRCKITKIAHLAYKPKPISDDIATIALGYLGAAGINKPITAIWESIPFSFMVDYVLSVGDYLKALELTDFSLDVEIVDFGHSSKLVREGRAWETRGSRKNTSAPQVWSAAGKEIPYRARMYARHRCHPPVPESDPGQHLKWKLPSLKQWVLSYFCFR